MSEGSYPNKTFLYEELKIKSWCLIQAGLFNQENVETNKNKSFQAERQIFQNTYVLEAEKRACEDNYYKCDIRYNYLYMLKI